MFRVVPGVTTGACEVRTVVVLRVYGEGPVATNHCEPRPKSDIVLAAANSEQHTF